MTSRERVMCAFNHVKADRMPIDYFGNIAINNKLCKHFHTDYDGMLDALDIDIRPVYVPYIGKKLYPDKDGMIVDPAYGYYAKWIEHSTGGYWDYCYYPLQDADDEVIANYPLADPNDFDYSVVAERIKMNKDRALHIGNGGYADIINATTRVMSMEQTLINLQLEDEATLTYIKRRNHMELCQLEKIIQTAKGRIDFMWIGEDLGTQIAPMISLETYRNVLRPLHQQYIDLAKSYNIPVMMHTCGCSSWAYEDFIDMGVKAVDTLQPEVKSMEPESLIARFKGRLAFHGSISTAGPLAYGTPEDVDADVKHKCDVYRDTYSYMISPTHSIQDNSPMENVLAMYKAAMKYGKY